MAKKEAEPKITLEREYIVPLRKDWLKAPKYRRTPRAIKALKQFIARHMKVEERELKKVKLDKWLNYELWFRGIQNPMHKIRVKAIKYDSGIVKVSLVEIPKIIQYKIDKEKKSKEAAEKVKEAKKAEEVEKPEERTEEEKKEEVEKEKAVAESGFKQAEKKAKEVKHETVMKHQPKHQFRQALKK